MISFGAAFGYTVMARMSLLIGRLTDLIEFSDASYGRPTIWLLLVTVGALFLLTRKRQEIVDQLAQRYTADSLARMAWGLFRQWLFAEGPPKDKWAHHTLGKFPDDDARRDEDVGDDAAGARWPAGTSSAVGATTAVNGARSGVPVDWTYKILRWFHKPSRAVMVATNTVEGELRGRGFDEAGEIDPATRAA